MNLLYSHVTSVSYDTYTIGQLIQVDSYVLHGIMVSSRG